MGLSVGAGVLVAHYVGAKKKRDVNITLHTAILLSVISGVIIGVLGFIFAEDMLIIMKTDADLLPYATLYLKIIFLGTPGSLLYNYIASMLRSAGDSKRPLIFLAISGIVNVLLNIFLVTVFKLDVAGDILKISAESTIGSTYDEVAVEHEDRDIVIAFNNRYLMDSVRACDGELVTLKMSTPLTSMNIEPCYDEDAEEKSDEIFMLLPVRMKENYEG